MEKDQVATAMRQLWEEQKQQRKDLQAWSVKAAAEHQQQRGRADGAVVVGAQAEEAAEATRSIELQLHDLVLELRKLQQEQQAPHRQSQGSEPRSPDGLQKLSLRSLKGQDEKTETIIAASILKDLTEERGHVAQMLDGVKQEKLEVIAMMHSFQMDKSEALKDLEGLWQAARTELAASAAAVRKASSATPIVPGTSPVAQAPGGQAGQVAGQQAVIGPAISASPVSPVMAVPRSLVQSTEGLPRPQVRRFVSAHPTAGPCVDDTLHIRHGLSPRNADFVMLRSSADFSQVQAQQPRRR